MQNEIYCFLEDRVKLCLESSFSVALPRAIFHPFQAMFKLLSNLFFERETPRPDLSKEALLNHSLSDDIDTINIAPISRRGFFRWYHASHAVLLPACLFLLVNWFHTPEHCTEVPYSPANAAISYHDGFTIFNGTFDYPSIYRGEPSLELDKAWHRVSKGVKTTRLTIEELQKIGKQDTPSKVKFSEADGGGYMASIEVSHELHCLNVFRKYLYFDYYGKSDPFFTESKPKTYRMHLEHCIELLRQSLMCTANSGMITFEWVRGFSTPYPDFNTRHKCRDFERIIGWQDDHAVLGVPQSHVLRLDGEIDLEKAP